MKPPPAWLLSGIFLFAAMVGTSIGLNPAGGELKAYHFFLLAMAPCQCCVAVALLPRR
ncbi:MAG: hypothetical protein ABMA13_18415 [Chthoniobacteraceae bacterium]